MKINEFIEFATNGKNKMLKADQLQELICKTLDVKDYISVKDKKALIDSIVNNCIMYDNGVFKFD